MLTSFCILVSILYSSIGGFFILINKDLKRKQFVRNRLSKVFEELGKAEGLTEFLGKSSDECFFTKMLYENHTELNVLVMR